MNVVMKLDSKGPSGEDVVLAVDFNNRVASVIMIDARNGNLRVTDVQTIAQRGA
jgi:hypothetical protein